MYLYDTALSETPAAFEYIWETIVVMIRFQ